VSTFRVLLDKEGDCNHYDQAADDALNIIIWRVEDSKERERAAAAI